MLRFSGENPFKVTQTFCANYTPLIRNVLTYHMSSATQPFCSEKLESEKKAIQGGFVFSSNVDFLAKLDLVDENYKKIWAEQSKSLQKLDALLVLANEKRVLLKELLAFDRKEAAKRHHLSLLKHIVFSFEQSLLQTFQLFIPNEQIYVNFCMPSLYTYNNANVVGDLRRFIRRNRQVDRFFEALDLYCIEVLHRHMIDVETCISEVKATRYLAHPIQTLQWNQADMEELVNYLPDGSTRDILLQVIPVVFNPGTKLYNPFNEILERLA